MVGPVNISHIIHRYIGSPVPWKFGNLRTDGCRTLDRPYAPIVDIDSFVALKADDPKGHPLKWSEGLVVQV